MLELEMFGTVRVVGAPAFRIIFRSNAAFELFERLSLWEISARVSNQPSPVLSVEETVLGLNAVSSSSSSLQVITVFFLFEISLNQGNMNEQEKESN